MEAADTITPLIRYRHSCFREYKLIYSYYTVMQYIHAHSVSGKELPKLFLSKIALLKRLNNPKVTFVATSTVISF